MAEVSLNIRVNSREAVDAVGELIKKNEELQKSLEDVSRAQKELFDANRKGFGDINKAKEYEKAMGGLSDTAEDLKRKIEDNNKTIEKYNDTQKTATKGTAEFGGAFSMTAVKAGLLGAAVVALRGLMRGLTDAFKDTTFGIKTMTAAGELWRQLTYNLIRGNTDLAQSIASSFYIAKQESDFRKKNRSDLIEGAKLQLKYAEAYNETGNNLLSTANQLKAVNEALKVHQELTKFEIANAYEELTQLELKLIRTPESNKLLDEEAKLRAKIINIEAQRELQEKRLEERRTGLMKQEREDMLKKWYDEIEASNVAYEKKIKRQQEYQDAASKLQEDFAKSEIEKLSGYERLAAERDFANKQLTDRINDLMKLGPLTPEMMKNINGLANNIQRAFLQSMEFTPVEREAFAEVFSNAIKGLPKFDDPTKLRPYGGTTIKPSIWGALGINPDSEQQEAILDGLKEVKEASIEAIDSIYQKRVDDAQRNRELADQRITEAQNELAIEAQLMEAGFANNVTIKRKELEEAKKIRAEALADEVKALNEQRKVELVFQAMNMASSISSLIKSITKTSGPLALVLAPIAIAALLGLWANAKTKVNQSVKLAEGGSGSETGLITGRSHHQGGERFLDHVEVERGERWGVLNRMASNKYGKVFEDIVNSFNRNEIPAFGNVNNILVNNDGSNSRLDKVIAEQQKLNKQFGKDQIMIVGGRKIITNGSNVRIIG